MTVRRAVVTGARDAAQVAAYLPGNYRVYEERYTQAHGAAERHLVDVTIEGKDNAGWTLDDYVIPRLASGLMACKEVEVLVSNSKRVDVVSFTHQGIAVHVNVNQDLADVIDDILSDLYAAYPEERYERLAELADELGQIAISKEA